MVTKVIQRDRSFFWVTAADRMGDRNRTSPTQQFGLGAEDQVKVVSIKSWMEMQSVTHDGDLHCHPQLKNGFFKDIFDVLLSAKSTCDVTGFEKGLARHL
jgi:hypothetical protein